ncbi:MAG: DNA cytosine methyltransferase [Bacilli bacterium]|nr:DNA cytosine methyltransferase [Bacilli bacterium]
MKKKFKFIDLFAGIGGFHQAMTQLGGECVFASEIDPYAIETYFKNYGINSECNIRNVKVENIPKHDVLCAGFPCQAFSKAGHQKGFKDETKGTLFFEIERILNYHKTKYIILENVKNLLTHDHGRTWKVIYKHLKQIGYRLTEKPIVLSPHELGIPQLRDRVVILGIYDPDNKKKDLKIEFDNLKTKQDNDIFNIIERKKVSKKYYISEHEKYVLNAWDEFYNGINDKIIGFPIWYDYFKKKPETKMPNWKKEFIRKNNELYKRNKDFIDTWAKKYNYLSEFNKTQRKFEWQCGKEITSLWDGIIQFRPSGIRVKNTNCFPALVALVQIPIIGKYRRRLTVREAARLQSFPDAFVCNQCDQQAYKQFGNAVNVEVIKQSFEKLINYKEEQLNE